MNTDDRRQAAEYQRRGLAPVGLSTPHSSPAESGPNSNGPGDYDEFRDGDGNIRLPSLEFALGGEFAHISIPRPLSAKMPGGRRGQVKRFSHASRRRLQKTLASIDHSATPRLPLFVTLTYPRLWPANPERWKTQLDTFLKRLSRRFPDASCVWKLEYQKRGAPHYHLLVFNVVYISRHWLAQAWNEIAAPGDADHLKAGTEVRRIRTWRGVASYAAKYMSKAEDLHEHGNVGRYWGVHNRKGLAITMLKVNLSWRQAYKLRRVFYRALDKKGVKILRRSHLHGQSMFIASGILLNILDAIDGPGKPGTYSTWEGKL